MEECADGVDGFTRRDNQAGDEDRPRPHQRGYPPGEVAEGEE
jgi:hypothetical protein